MTGELCDCFASKSDGVRHILGAVAQLTGTTPVWVWRTAGRLVNLATARREDALLVAAANWLALATWAGRLAPSGSALVLDVGSTTTDVIPLHAGVPCPVGRTDPERLHSGELIYTGIRRTPVCALGGADSRLAAEWFATTHDVYLLLGQVAEDPSDSDTADGRPATRAHAHARLARMLCADLESSSAAEPGPCRRSSAPPTRNDSRMSGSSPSVCRSCRRPLSWPALASSSRGRPLESVNQPLPPSPLPEAERGSRKESHFLSPLSASGRGLGGGVDSHALSPCRIVSLQETMGARPVAGSLCVCRGDSAAGTGRTHMSDSSLAVVKVGGSLYDLPDLGERAAPG